MRHDTLHDEPARLAALRRYEILDTPPEAAFQRVVELVRAVLGAPMAAVTLIDRDRQWLKARVGPLARETPRDSAFCTETIKRTGALAVPDATLDGRFAANPQVTGAPHVLSYLGVPLTTSDGYNIGTLCAFDTEPRPFEAREADILRKLADIVTEQIELRLIARQDALTGALTRRGFLAEVEKEFLRATRYDRPSTLVLIDVDHFTGINDRYGHAAGDAVLVSIAGACMATMRKSDAFGRIGGEEFGLLLPETEANEAGEAAERIRRLIESTLVQTGGLEVRATVSLGVAAIPAAAEGVGSWHDEADIALDEAKRSGRNRVVVAKPRRLAPAAASEPPAEPAPRLN
jgi:diguanylate cyclase (GGDEF)-like protein